MSKDMRIDVCLVTKLEEIPNWWFKRLSYLPLNKLIIERSKPLGLARMKAIQQVETEWFAFIDDDALISPSWFEEISKHIKNDVGAIQGREQYVGLGKKWDEDLRTYRWNLGTKELKQGDRGSTVDTLIRTNLVKDWKPQPINLSSWEDYKLTQHILDKGYKWLEVNVHCKHFRGWIPLIKKVFWNRHGYRMALSSKTEIRHIVRAIGAFVIFPLQCLFHYLFIKNLNPKYGSMDQSPEYRYINIYRYNRLRAILYMTIQNALIVFSVVFIPF